MDIGTLYSLLHRHVCTFICHTSVDNSAPSFDYGWMILFPWELTHLFTHGGHNIIICHQLKANASIHKMDLPLFHCQTMFVLLFYQSTWSNSKAIGLKWLSSRKMLLDFQLSRVFLFLFCIEIVIIEKVAHQCRFNNTLIVHINRILSCLTSEGSVFWEGASRIQWAG